jgi:hypothetical protein
MELILNLVFFIVEDQSHVIGSSFRQREGW